MALTLRFLGTGESFSSLEYQFQISKRAISYIVFEVCSGIYSEMGDLCLAFPSSTDDWRAIEKCFRDKWNFPHCVDALDRKHVVIRCGLFYYDYKGMHSIVLMGLAGMAFHIYFFSAQTMTV